MAYSQVNNVIYDSLVSPECSFYGLPRREIDSRDGTDSTDTLVV